MSGSDLIATATLSLCALLREGLASLPDAPEVLAGPPWKGPDDGVCVHLFAVAPSARLAREDRDGRIPAPPWQAAPRAMSLRYLLSFFGPQDVRIHRLTGRALELLEEGPVMTGTALAEIAARAGLRDPSGAQMRLAIDPLSIEEMTRLWQRFAPMRYTLSLGVACDIAG